MQKPVQHFESDCGRANIYVENEMPIGVFHDFLMLIKGAMVQRMIEAHKQQEVESEQAKVLPVDPSELPSPCEDHCVNKYEPITTPEQSVEVPNG